MLIIWVSPVETLLSCCCCGGSVRRPCACFASVNGLQKTDQYGLSRTQACACCTDHVATASSLIGCHVSAWIPCLGLKLENINLAAGLILMS